MRTNTTPGNMLRILTKKLKSSSLNEAHSQEEDNDNDSGTESDNENNNLDDDHYAIEQDSSISYFERDKIQIGNRKDKTKTHEISDHNFDTISCTSDYERHSLDFDGHSSEDELESIAEETINENFKLKIESCQSTSSTDEEVKELLYNPHPVLLRTSPPKGVIKVYTENEATEKVDIRVVTPNIHTATSRKRHRRNTFPEPQSDSDEESVIQRPCLNFEKMQQVRRLCPSYFKRYKMSKNVKLQTV